MSERSESSRNGGQDPSGDRQELEHQIEETRAELADAVEALAYKADVKARAKDKAGQLKEQAKETAGHLSDSAQEVGRSPQGQRAGAIGLGVLVIAVIAWLVARRRS